MSSVGEAKTPGGNCWIIGRSKSHIGRNYYFNTLTGESVWNLNEIEMEKAKKMTSIMQNEPGFAIEDCPEPLESPQQHLAIEKQQPAHYSGNIQQFPHPIVPPKVYNKQIINNQFSKPINQYPSQFLPFTPMNAVQFNVPFSTAFNPGMWNVTPQQVFLNPTFNQSQPVINDTFNNFNNVPVTETVETLSNRFKKLSGSRRDFEYSINNVQKEYDRGHSQFRQRPKNNGGLFEKVKSETDLRLFLSKKRRNLNIINEAEENNFNDDTHFYNNHPDTKHGSVDVFPDKRRRSYSFNSNADKDDDDDVDDNWLEENMKVQGRTNAVEIEKLRSLLQITESSDIWFVVTDSDVLLNNINFLNILLNSDGQCRLVIPQIVMNKIHCATNSRFRTHARRAAYFISQQVDANLAIIDESTTSVSEDRDEIINCCERLIDEGNHVVLITDDIELRNNENASNVTILTMREVKQLVVISKSNQSPIKNLNALAKGRNLKITIENDANTQNDNKNSQSPTKKYTISQVVDEEEDSEESSNTNVFQINKIVYEVGDRAKSVSLPKIAEIVNNKLILSNSSKVSENNTSSKMSGFKLKRNLSRHVSPKPKNTDKRSVWHRYKTKSSSSLTDDIVKVGDGIASLCTISDLEAKSTNESVVYDNENAVHNNKNLTRGTSSCKSAESLHKHVSQNYDGCSESSSVTLKDVNPRENVIIEETCASGMSLSIVDTGNEKGVNADSNQSSAECNKNNVMFEVTDLKMEEFLKMKSDEWVSRFVQILEEALTQVLHLDPPFVLDSMPPPWTVHEATECVKRKFHYDPDVIDAAAKLLNVSFENGGLRGKIKPNINPNKYMELYSYGVYLIDALQAILSNNEDLQTAAESLSKLLRDIQDPHLDPSNQDSFADNIEHENTVKDAEDYNTSKLHINLDHINNDENHNEEMKKGLKWKSSKRTKITLGTYNLRSQRKNNLEETEKTADNINISRNVDNESSFFSSLHLKKNLPTDVTIEKETFISAIDSKINDGREEKSSTSVVPKNDKHVNTLEKTMPQDARDETKLNEPRIIRNFIKCPEFEERLKNKSKSFCNDSWIDNNEENTDEYTNEEYMETECYSDDYALFEDESYESENVPYEEEATANTNVQNEKNAETCPVQNNAVPFRLVIEKLVNDIKTAYTSIQEFCVKSCNSLLCSNTSTADKDEMQQRAEKAYSHINSICDVLNKILKREQFGKNIFELLNREDLAGKIVFEDNDLENYKEYIGTCLEQGTILKESISLVLEFSKE